MQLGSPNFIQLGMFHDKSWKPIYSGSEGQRSRSRVTKTLLAWVFALLWVLACASIIATQCIRYESIYNNRIVKLSRHTRGLRGRTDGQAMVGRQARVADRLRAEIKGLGGGGWCHAKGMAYEDGRMDGRAGTGLLTLKGTCMYSSP